MNATPDQPSDASQAEQEELRLLDDYLRQLQLGQQLDLSAIAAEHPDLVATFACLEALENLAPHTSSPDDNNFQSEASGITAELPRPFGAYELLREIGRGGMGVVYLARQAELDRTVAIKMILANHLASPEHVRRFHAEAKAAAGVRHPHIVHIHEVGRLEGQDYFAMEYVEGESLAERIQRGPVEPLQAVHLVGAVARAVAHLHRQGIVHRDLKPSNILIDSDDRPYVTDFGLAKVLRPDSQMTATGVIAGTPSYMAPEQASGHGSAAGPQADVYSLGAILYELLTGQPPFCEENPFDTLLAVLGHDPPLPRKINPRIARGLELICLKCLAKTPEERYRSAEALAEDLERFARGEPLEVRPPGWAQRLIGWTRRQPALASRFGALGLFYGIEMTSYMLSTVPDDFHWQVSLVVAVWMTASIVCQQIIDRYHWDNSTPFVWGALDSICLFAALRVGNGVASPLVVGYPLLIVASGLWFRVRFVWFMALLSLVSYGVLVVDFYWWWPELSRAMEPGLVRHIIFAVSLVVLAALVAYLVRRVRVLSSFYGRPAI